MKTAATAFDALARSYDQDFVGTRIGTRMRDAIWRRCAARFPAGTSVLEMNCGTGVDAAWLAARGVDVLATDTSVAMLEVAREKAGNHNWPGKLRFQQLSWEQLDSLQESGFDGALSNFGGLNCVEDLKRAAKALAVKLRPGATALLCIMGPLVPWEWVWFLAHGQSAKAFRRLRRGGAVWSGVSIHYPTVGAVRRCFRPEFKMVRAAAIGAVLPPPYTEPFFAQHARTLAVLDYVERRCERLWPLPQLADHYLLEMVRL